MIIHCIPVLLFLTRESYKSDHEHHSIFLAFLQYHVWDFFGVLLLSTMTLDRLRRFELHAVEQQDTSSQQRSHFFLHVKGRPHTTQIFSGRFFLELRSARPCPEFLSPYRWVDIEKDLSVIG